MYKKWSGAGRNKDNCTADLGLGVIGWELGCIGVYSTTGGLQCRKRHSMFIILVILRFRRIGEIRDFFKSEEWEHTSLPSLLAEEKIVDLSRVLANWFNLGPILYIQLYPSLSNSPVPSEIYPSSSTHHFYSHQLTPPSQAALYQPRYPPSPD